MIIDLLVKVGIATATALGVTADTLTLSQLAGWDGLGDDHPLYSTPAASPKIDFTATKEMFRLLLVQPNEIGETVDDYPVSLTGKVYEELAPGIKQELWSYDLTYTYDDITLSASSRNKLFVSGIIKHIVAPHADDIKEAPALKVDNLLTAPEVCVSGSCSPPDPPIVISSKGLLSEIGHPAHHTDRIIKDELSARVMTPTLFNWYNWSHEVKAVHKVPAPLPILGAGVFVGHARKLRRMSRMLHRGVSKS